MLFKLISKYALLLSLFYFMEIILSKLIREYGGDWFEGNSLLRFYVPFIFTFILNIIAAILLNKDAKTADIRTNLITIATLLFRPVGVVAFILFAMQRRVENN